MGSAPPPPSIPATPEDTQRAITRAKQEWESTADTLPHVVCLLNEQARAIRVNRVIEAWNLGRVSEVLGRDVHALLHPAGCTAHCELRANLERSWDRLTWGEYSEFELNDAQLGRSISVTLRPMLGADPTEKRPDSPRAVMIVYDVTPLHSARAALVTLNESLEARVRTRTAQLEASNRDLQSEMSRREQAEEALRESRNELAILSQQLIQAQEGERRRIAQELHDSVGQSMSAIKYSLERATELQRQERHAEARPLLLRIVERVQETIGEIRSIAMNLRPSVLDDLGVASALAWLCREFAETYPDLRVASELHVEDHEIPHWLGTTIFRCTQELLNNVARHSRARSVQVLLAREGARICLQVEDDGVGLPQASSTGSFGRGHGIRNLRERAQMTHGRFKLTAGSKGGTCARLEWELSPGGRAEELRGN